MSGESTSPAPSGNRAAIATALSAVKTLSAVNGAPLKTRALALAEESANHEVGALLYDIARAHMLENDDLRIGSAFHYQNPRRDQLEAAVTAVEARIRGEAGTSLAAKSVGQSASGPLHVASRLLDLAEERLGERSAICSARSALEATLGNTETAASLAQRALTLATTRQHRDSALRNLARALIRAENGEAALAAANEAVTEFGPSRAHLYNRLCAHVLLGDTDSFKACAREFSEPDGEGAADDPESWTAVITSHLKWMSSKLKVTPDAVLSSFDFERLS